MDDGIVLTHEKSAQRFRLSTPSFTIGRSSRNDLAVSAKSVSRHHALIEVEAGAAFIKDLASRNGTFVEGHRLLPHQRKQLRPGMHIRFGDKQVFVISGCTDPMLAPDVSVAFDNESSFDVSSSAVMLLAESDISSCDRPKGDFGFEPERLDFFTEGVGPGTAGQLLNRFRPIQVLSSGGMGTVVLVQETLSGRVVAMKVMLEWAQEDPGLVQQFIREGIITARLHHPHVIPVHELGFLERGQLYFTMNYVEGVTLSKLIPKGDVAENLRILRCAALAVSHAHSKGLWHRDLKPHNILVGMLGDVYVIDWGLVSVEPDRDYPLSLPPMALSKLPVELPPNLFSDPPSHITSMSCSGFGSADVPIIGTPLYMSPEQVRGETDSLGRASDIWAFGVMLYETLTARNPWQVREPDPSRTSIYEQILEAQVVPPGELNPAAPPELVELCLQMLSRNVVARMRGLTAFIDEAASFLQHYGYAVPPALDHFHLDQ